jgi:stage II sporulation protein D
MVLKLSKIFFVCIFVSFTQTALALPTNVLVKVFSAQPNIQKVELKGQFILIPSNCLLTNGTYKVICTNNSLGLYNHQKKLLLKTQSLVLQSQDAQGIGLQAAKGPARYYPGQIKIYKTPGCKLKILNQLTAKQYVSLVIASETLPDWPFEALKAQAVLTQTRLVKYKIPSELLDSTQNEAYLGLAFKRPEAEKAVNEVWRQILVFDRMPVVPFYHSTCAGRTSTDAYFKGALKGASSYSKAVNCSFCKASPFANVTGRKIPKKQFEANFTRVPTIIDSDSAGRALKVTLANGKTITGYQFWLLLGQKFGWDKAPGTNFKITKDLNGDYWIDSLGGGHGVGLCQWGAAGMAKQGKHYKQILSFYFPGTNLKQF